ncbi:MAG TPA: SurA N-terminal domain-containing protein, partial [Thermoanaerobaculia bacterium]|nr:SurA N-terminal domain-containing protein [Thermoanaerobaculia bacterium]
MLKQMREGFRHLKWILFLVIFVFLLLVFVDWGGAGRGGASAIPQGFAASVNGDLIPLNDFGRALSMLEQQYEQMYGQPLTEEMRAA